MFVNLADKVLDFVSPVDIAEENQFEFSQSNKQQNKVMGNESKANESNETIEHAMTETNKKIYGDLLKACFGNDQSTILKVEKQLEAIFKDFSGMFQSK